MLAKFHGEGCVSAGCNHSSILSSPVLALVLVPVLVHKYSKSSQKYAKWVTCANNWIRHPELCRVSAPANLAGNETFTTVEGRGLSVPPVLGQDRLRKEDMYEEKTSQLSTIHVNQASITDHSRRWSRDFPNLLCKEAGSQSAFELHRSLMVMAERSPAVGCTDELGGTYRRR